MPSRPAAGHLLAGQSFVLRALGCLGVLGVVIAFSGPATGQQIDSVWLTPSSGDWADASNWSSAAFPNNDETTQFTATIDAQGGGSYMVSLDTSIAVNGLVLDAAEAIVQAGDITVQVNGNADLEAGTFVMDGTLLDGGTWTLGAEGMLTGNGEVDATLVLGPGGSLAPGFSAGQLTINGNYVQDEGGLLEVDVLGVDPGEFDSIDITGQADLGGTLIVDASEADGLLFGDAVPLLTASALTPGDKFDEVITTGVIDGYFAPTYNPDGVSLGYFQPGDMNRDGFVDEADVSPFALALIRPLDYFGTYFVFGDESGDINGDGVQDFDDINGFMSLIDGASVSTLIDEINRLNGVPEPASTGLLAAAFTLPWLRLTGGRKRAL
ncbi:MAG: hypothetical protein AAGJ46_04540 [Planctomycetota bacterium]